MTPPQYQQDLMELNITLYLENGKFSAYIGDDCGGSGIRRTAETKEQLAEKIKLDILDYLDNF